MLNWLRRRESKKGLNKLLNNPAEESNKIVMYLTLTLRQMRKFDDSERRNIKKYYDRWVEKIMSEAEGDAEKLYWATFKYGHRANELLKSGSELESIGINLSRFYAKSIILNSDLINKREVFDFSNGSNIVEMFEKWDDGGELEDIALHVFGNNPLTGGYNILLNILVD